MSEPTKKPVNQYGWVIEGAWSPANAPEYWVGSSIWSTDPYSALRFSRKQDAEQIAAMMLDGIRIRICEHVWTYRLALVCGVDCFPGDELCNNYCNQAPQKGPMAARPPNPTEREYLEGRAQSARGPHHQDMPAAADSAAGTQPFERLRAKQGGAMSDYTLEEALEDARGWVEGTTFHKGQRGWKPALAVILDEFDCVTKDHADCDEFAAALMKERDELAARLAEAERDAARYRWLRRGLCVTEIRTLKERMDEPGVDDESYSAEVDAAIDAAMKEPT